MQNSVCAGFLALLRASVLLGHRVAGVNNQVFILFACKSSRGKDVNVAHEASTAIDARKRFLE